MAVEAKVTLILAWLVRVGKDASCSAARPLSPWLLKVILVCVGFFGDDLPGGIEFFQLILFLFSSLKQINYPHSALKSREGHPITFLLR